MSNITTIMAYGQSGAGKTYTINHLIKSVISDLYSKHSFDEVKCSYYQIYNEKIYDLIIQNPKLQKYKFLHKDLKVKLMQDGNYGIDGLTLLKCNDADELMKLYVKSSK